MSNLTVTTDPSSVRQIGHFVRFLDVVELAAIDRFPVLARRIEDFHPR